MPNVRMQERDDRRRKGERYDFPATIEYVLDQPNASEVLKGVVINISASGLAAYVFSPLPEGQKIIITSALPLDTRTATVLWIEKKDESFFLTGLKFVDRTS